MPIPSPPDAPSSGGFAFGETVIRLRGTVSPDPYSGEMTTVDWTTPDELAIPGCGFAPSGSTEPVEQGRDAVITQPRIFAPSGSDVTAYDRLLVRGAVWEVDGDPADWRHPMTGWAPGMVIPLKAVSG